MTNERFIATCTHAGFRWVERAMAESDPSLKQIIPYIVIVHNRMTSSQSPTSLSSQMSKDTAEHPDGDPLPSVVSVAVYRRKGSEKRLHDLYSIGIGGHINPEDDRMTNGIKKRENFHSSDEDDRTALHFQRILHAGMNRELEEELIRRPKADEPKFLGIINEDVTEVGSVHLGALYVILTQSPHLYKPGHELMGFHWVKKDALTDLNLELWSSMALGLLLENQII